MNIMVTGGAGYVGSVCAAELLKRKHHVVTYDNLSAGVRRAVLPGITFVQGDIADRKKLQRTCRQHRIEVVMHFAGSIQVGESVRDPGLYYRNNVSGTLTLLDVIVANGIGKLVFSSSAAVYGEPQAVPIPEDHPTSPINPYGETKLVIERALAWYHRIYGLRAVALRYFNAAGAWGALGENHNPETHLIPRVLNAAADGTELFQIYGDDYPTPDRTCIRDYVHVHDIARAHILAMRKLSELPFTIYNIGHGRGYSIREVLRAAEEATRVKIPVALGPRRSGDPAVLVASPERIRRDLGWEPREDLASIVRSAWLWRSHFWRGPRQSGRKALAQKAPVDVK